MKSGETRKKNEKREKKGGRVEMLNTRQWKWDERGEESRPLERDFYFQSLFLAFQPPLTSINPLDFQNLMEVKLRIEAESRREDYCKLQRPDSPCGIVTLFSVCQKTISAHLPSFKTRWTLTVMISEQTMDTCPSICSISKLSIKNLKWKIKKSWNTVKKKNPFQLKIFWMEQRQLGQESNGKNH